MKKIGLFGFALLLLLVSGCNQQTPPATQIPRGPVVSGVGVCHWIPEDQQHVSWGYDATYYVAWRNYEPQQGVFDWALLDEYVNARIGLGVDLWLALQTVGESAGLPKAPDWILAQAQWHRCSSSDPNGIFAPWDPAYQSALADFLAAVNAHIKEQSAAYQSAVAGIVIMSGGMYGEMQLYSCSMDDKLADYYGLTVAELNAQYEAGVKAVVDIYGEAFPDLPLMLQVGYTENVPQGEVEKAVVEYAVTTRPGRILLKWNGLDPTAHPNAIAHYTALFSGYAAQGVQVGFEAGHPKTYEVDGVYDDGRFDTVFEIAINAGASFMCFQNAPTARLLDAFFDTPGAAQFEADLKANAGQQPQPTATPSPTASPSGSPTPTALPSPPTPTASPSPPNPVPGNAWPDDDLNQALVDMRAAGKTTLYLHGGTYYLDEGLRLGPQDSGVTIRNAPGERPMLVGGRPVVTRWDQYTTNIYRTRVSGGFDALMEYGVLATMARYPNDGYLAVETQLQEPCRVCGGTYDFGYKAGSFPSFDIDDASVVMQFGNPNDPGSVFWNEVLRINSVGNGVMQVAKHVTWYPILAGMEYYLRGSIAFLDEPGEFYLDTSTDFLYYWPRQGLGEIVMASTSRLIEIVGATDVTIDGLHLTLTDGVYRNWLSPPPWQRPEQEHALVYVKDAARIAITNNLIENAGWDGVGFRNAVQDSRVEGNIIRNVGRSGVSLTGLWPSPDHTAYVNHHNTVSDNLLTDGTAGGLWVADGSGHQAGAISLYQSGDNTITHNTITRWPRMGFTITEQNWSNMHDEHAPCPGCWDYLHSRDNYIGFNDVSHVLQDSNDGGGIFIHGGGLGNVIDNNRVHDIEAGAARNKNTHGIYIDDHSNGVLITNNIVFGIAGSPGKPVTMKGSGNTIDNNVFADNETNHTRPHAPIDLWNVSKKDVIPGIRFGQQVVTRNIFYRDQGDILYYWRFWEYAGDVAPKTVDYNVVWHPGGGVRILTELPPGNAYTFSEWQAMGYDTHSVVADPLFVDAANHDYTVRPASPALTLGFRNIDQDSIGLQSEPGPGLTPTPAPTPTGTSTPLPTLVPTPTSTPSLTPSPTHMQTPTSTPTATWTPTPTPTGTLTPTAEAVWILCDSQGCRLATPPP